jgi:hypothetical protein
MYTDYWKKILEKDSETWQKILQQPLTQTTSVLFCTSVGFSRTAVVHDSLLAAALIARGVKVEMLLCDGVLPACEACTYSSIKPHVFLEKGPQAKRCHECWKQGQGVFSSLNLPLHRYSQFLNADDYCYAKETVKNLKDSELKTFTLDDMLLGEEAYSGALRYFKVGDLTSEPDGIPILRRYVEGAILTYRAITKVFRELKPDVAVFHHGIYVPQGVISKVARQMGVRVVNWSIGYRSQSFIYSHEDTYHHTMLDEPVHLWKDKKLNESEKNRIVDYLESRRIGVKDWISYNAKPEERESIIREELSLDSRPIILLLTNVIWDAQLYYQSNAFSSLLEWVHYSIQYFAERQDLQLVIRIHPAEAIRSKTRQPVADVIAQLFPTLPANVRVVEAGSEISTYTLADMANCVLIYGTKTGMELAARGIPVIVAGEAWVRNKGFTSDVSSQEEYKQYLDQLPLAHRMPDEQRELALQYANHYFFRRLIPLAYLVHYSDEKPALFKKEFLRSQISRLRNSTKSWLKQLRYLQSDNTSKLTRKVLKQLALENNVKSLDSWLKNVDVWLKENNSEPKELQYTIDIDEMHVLEPGWDKGLDVVCNGIINHCDFIFEENLEGVMTNVK